MIVVLGRPLNLGYVNGFWFKYFSQFGLSGVGTGGWRVVGEGLVAEGLERALFAILQKTPLEKTHQRSPEFQNSFFCQGLAVPVKPTNASGKPTKEKSSLKGTRDAKNNYQGREGQAWHMWTLQPKVATNFLEEICQTKHVLFERRWSYVSFWDFSFVQFLQCVPPCSFFGSLVFASL